MDEGWIEIENDAAGVIPSAPSADDLTSNTGRWVSHVVHIGDYERVKEPRPEHRRHVVPDEDITSLMRSIKDTGALRIGLNQPLFLSNKGRDVALAFRSSLGKDFQAQLNCSLCTKFLNRYGGLSIVDLETGYLIPLFWNEQMLGEGNILFEPVASCAKIVCDGLALKEFNITKTNLEIGKELAGGFKHMHFRFPSSFLRHEGPKGFNPAEVTVRARMLDKILQDFDNSTVQKTARLILQDKLPYASEHKASIRWLKDIWDEARISRARGHDQRQNLLLHYAASSFVGCIKQLRSGVLWVLLHSVKHYSNYSEIERTWNIVANPSSYMRPSASPSAGQIMVAERLFQDLGFTADDMRRQFATSEDIPLRAFIYKEVLNPLNTSYGVFGKLTPKTSISRKPKQPGSTQDNLPASSMSFAKFLAEIIPRARTLEVQLPTSIYLFFLTKGLSGRKPLMQWHNENNSVSWYTRSNATSLPAQGLSSGWTVVKSIVAFPHLWVDMEASTLHQVPRTSAEIARFRHNRHGIRYLLQLEGAHEQHNAELALFPSFLKWELHGVRSTIEAYSREGSVEVPLDSTGVRQQYVGGIALGSDLFHDTSVQNLIMRVEDEKGELGTYQIVTFA